MSDYKKLLNALTLTNIKALVRTYISHVKFTVAKKTKDELIEHIMKHTELVDGKVKTKLISFDMVKNKEKVKKEKVVKEKKEKPKKDDEKPKKVVEEKKDKKEKSDVVYTDTWALKRAEPKMTDEQFKEQQRLLMLRRRNDPLATIYPDKLIKNIDKFKDFKTGDKNDDFFVEYIVKSIKDGDDFFHSYDERDSKDARRVVDMMMKHLDVKDVAKQVVKKVMNDGRQTKRNV